MRKDADLKSRVKNSTIYFQLGLIATMLVVLFVLEIQFKQDVKIPEVVTIPIDDDDILITRYTVIEHNTPESTPVKKVKPKIELPKEITKLDVKKNDEDLKPTETKTQDDATSTDTDATKNNVVANPNDGNSNAPKKDVNIFNVEQLPMFPECKGLDRNAQKECFDSQLMKAIVKNLSYPDKDYRNGNQGTALIEFIIDENGNIVNVKALDNKRATESMQEAAKRAVRKLPRLIPAKQGKDNVRIKYTIPISFRIQ